MIPIQLDQPSIGNLSFTNRQAVYSIHLENPSNIVAHLKNINGDASLVLKKDDAILATSNNVGTNTEYISFSALNHTAERLKTLDPGDYTVEVLLQGESATYELLVSAHEITSLDVGEVKSSVIYPSELTADESHTYEFFIAEEGDYLLSVASPSKNSLDVVFSKDDEVLETTVDAMMPIAATRRGHLSSGKYTVKVTAKANASYVFAVHSVEKIQHLTSKDVENYSTEVETPASFPGIPD
ncbi:hypothetical protein OsccyDRAFT_0573 [Leptolyngbyaceae cyanobacterium JSC-12]|nr:hypothetical protein OsccyDRAFT_0573 [Leptolyngbyaceae cyanobacterium JSC-12]